MAMYCVYIIHYILENCASCEYNEAIECLEENIEGHVLSFTRRPDSEQSDDSLSVKKKLKEHLDFNQVLDYLRERDGEV